MLAHDDVLHAGDLYEVLKSYPSSLEVRYMIEEAMKASPHAFSTSPPLSSDESVKIGSLCVAEKENAPPTTSSGSDLSLLPLSSTKDPRSAFSHEREQTEWLDLLLQSKVEEEVRRLAKDSPHLFRTSLPSLGGGCPLSLPPLAPSTTKPSKEISAVLSSRCYTAEEATCMTTSSATSSFSGNFSAEQRSTSHANDSAVAPFSTSSHSLPGKKDDNSVCSIASVSTEPNENPPDSGPKEVSTEKPVPSCKENQIDALVNSLEELRERIEKNERDFSTLMASLLSIPSLFAKKNKKRMRMRKCPSCTRGMHHRVFTDMRSGGSSSNSSSSKSSAEQQITPTEAQEADFFYYQLPLSTSVCSSYTMPQEESSSWPVYCVSSTSSGNPSALLRSVPHNAHSTSSEHHSLFTTRGVMGPPPLWRMALDRQDVPALRQQLARALNPCGDRSGMNAVTQEENEVLERERGERSLENDVREKVLREKCVSQQTLRSPFFGFSSPLLSRQSSPPTTIRSYPDRRSKWDSTAKDQREQKEYRRVHRFSTGVNKENKYHDSASALLSSAPSSAAVRKAKRNALHRIAQGKQDPEIKISSDSFSHSPEVQNVAKPIRRRGSVHVSQKSSNGAVPSALLSPPLAPSRFFNYESASNLLFPAQSSLVDSSRKTNVEETVSMLVSPCNGMLSSTPLTLPFEVAILENKIHSLSSERVLGINAVDVPPGFLDRCLIPLQCLEYERTENEAQSSHAGSTTETMTNGKVMVADRICEGKGKKRTPRTAQKKSDLSVPTSETRWSEFDERFPYQDDDDKPTRQERNRVNGGVRVLEVDDGSVAERAGLQPGDVVLEIAPFGPVQSCVMLAQILQHYMQRKLEHSHIHTASLPKNEEESHFASLRPSDEMVALVYRPLVPRLLHIPLRW